MIIEDMAGRKVDVPSKIEKVYCTSPIGSIVIYSLCPEKLVGWNYTFKPEEKKYILPEYQDLPNLGGWYAKNTGNTEEILKIQPDVVISMGDMNDMGISTADKIQEQLNLPVVMVDADLTKLDEAYIFLGKLLDEGAKASELAGYCKKTLQEVTEKVNRIPQDERVKVYYAEGSTGLETDPRGSTHTQVLDLVGGFNVANVTVQGGMGMTQVSLEQVLAWDPDVILSWNDDQGGYYSGIISDPKWREIKAVKEHRVYQTPHGPFNWFDRPWSVNRVLGVKWLANLLYPDIFDYDIKAEVKEFYNRFSASRQILSKH